MSIPLFTQNLYPPDSAFRRSASSPNIVNVQKHAQSPSRCTHSTFAFNAATDFLTDRFMQTHFLC